MDIWVGLEVINWLWSVLEGNFSGLSLEEPLIISKRAGSGVVIGSLVTSLVNGKLCDTCGLGLVIQETLGLYSLLESKYHTISS